MLTTMQYEMLREQLDRKRYSQTFLSENEEEAYEKAILEAKSIVKSVGLMPEGISAPELECSEMLNRLQVELRKKVVDIPEKYIESYYDGIRDAMAVIKEFYEKWRNII